MKVKWENPPPAVRKSGVWIERLSPLLKRPKVWANLGEFALSTCGELRAGKLSTPPGRWEFTGRSIPKKPGRGILYARYLGSKK